MEAVGVVAASYGVIEAVDKISDKIRAFVKNEELHSSPGISDQLRRLERQTILFKAVSVDLPEFLAESQDSSLAWLLMSINDELKRVTEIFFSWSKSRSKRAIILGETKLKEQLEKEIDRLSEDIQLLCGLHHTLMLNHVLVEVQVMKGLSQDAVKFSLESSKVFDSVDRQLAVLRSDFAGAFNLSNNPDEERETSKQRQEAIELVRQGLYEKLGKLNQPSLIFPFNLVSQSSHAAEGLPTRMVKLDTGAHDNWIHSKTLERWGVQYESTDDPKTYVGAGGGQFQALGCVTIFWYSTNKAKTKESVFLVHDELPFDAILGSSYIMAESMDAFAEGVFPLMHIMPKDELGSLRDTMTARGIDSEGIKKIQRAQKARAREENRQMKAASRATTRAGTPGIATPSAGLLYPTATRAGASRTTPLSSTPLSGTTPHGSGTSTPAATDDP